MGAHGVTLWLLQRTPIVSGSSSIHGDAAFTSLIREASSLTALLCLPLCLGSVAPQWRGRLLVASGAVLGLLWPPTRESHGLTVWPLPFRWAFGALWWLWWL